MTLAAGTDLEAARARLAQAGRVRVPGFLGAAAAQDLHAAIADEGLAWQRSLDNEANIDLPVALFEAQSAEDRALVEARVHREATDGFQYLYDRLRLDGSGEGALDGFHRRLNSEAGLAFARALTGDDRIVFADAQATRYLPGHFLTGHTDENERTGRLYAYVLNLAPRWRAEWGGLLTFLEDGEVTETFSPGFDVLNVFRVPQRHAVSLVAPFAGAARYSITGWWREKGPESWG